MDNNTVVVLCPMECECETLISMFAQTTKKQIGGYECFEAKTDELFVVIIRCLMGTVNAAVCTATAIERYSPKWVILAGTAGAHNPELFVNDIVVANKIKSLTNVVTPRRKPGEGTNPFEWKTFGIKSYFKKYGKPDFANDFECNKELVNIALSVPYSQGRVVAGTVGGGDVWNREADLISYYHTAKGTDCEAMEGVGVAQVCAMYDLPMIEIRVISNNELHENESFSKSSATNCQKFVFEFLKILKDKI